MKHHEMNMGILGGGRVLLLTESGIWDSCMAERWQLKWVREFILNLDVKTWTRKKIKALQITTLRYIFYKRTIGGLLTQSLGYAGKQVVLLGLVLFLNLERGIFCSKEPIEKMKRWKRTHRIIKLPSQKVEKESWFFIILFHHLHSKANFLNWLRRQLILSSINICNLNLNNTELALKCTVFYTWFSISRLHRKGEREISALNIFNFHLWPTHSSCFLQAPVIELSLICLGRICCF